MEPGDPALAEEEHDRRDRLLGSQSRKLPIRWNADDCSVAGSFYCDQSVRPYKQFNYIYEAADEEAQATTPSSPNCSGSFPMA